MGRIFEVRKHAMFARWNRMAKQFARVAKDINMAVKAGGADPASNPTLRRIMQNARAVNMPKDKVEAAIRRASGRDATNYHAVMYEGYAPHGVALLIETATDNPTRTVAHVRNIIGNNGGKFGATGSVSFQFQKMGVFRLDPAGIDQDELELDMIDHGLEEMGESTGEKGEPAAAALRVREFRPPAGGAGSAPHCTAIRRARVFVYRPNRTAGAAGHGRSCAHRQARAGRGRAARISLPGLSVSRVHRSTFAPPGIGSASRLHRTGR